MKLGFLSILGIAFIVLKLINAISWSWWFVLLPLYILPLTIVLALLCAFVLTWWVHDQRQ